MGRQATGDILEVREGIDVVVLAGPGQGVEDRSVPALDNGQDVSAPEAG
jgi:hypothetical protein